MATLPPLQPISRKQKDFPSRRAYLDYKAKQSGYKNYRDYLSTREKQGIPKSNAGRGPRSYQKKKGNHRENFYYSAQNLKDVENTLNSLVRIYKNNDYFLIAYGKPKKDKISSPSLQKALKEAKRSGTSSLKIGNIPHTLNELTILHHATEIPDFIEEAMEEANKFFESIKGFVIVRSVPENA